MISKATRRKLEITWNYQCAVCSKTDYLEMHHIIPKAEGGTDDYDNLILLCPAHHQEMHNRDSQLQKFLRDWENI